MDGEEAAICKRLSSILKSGKVRSTEEDERCIDEIINQRRVSFARKSSVKAFTYDAEGNNTVWDATYEEAAVQSDQSTNHTTADSAVQISIETPNPQQTQSSALTPAIMNKTRVNMDEDIEIEADDIQFAPVRQTIIHNRKFAIFDDGNANLNTYLKPIENTFINPRMLKENTGELLFEDNMQLESNIQFDKTSTSESNFNPPMDIVSVENKDFDLFKSNLIENAMNFTLRDMKMSIVNKLTEKVTFPPELDEKMSELDEKTSELDEKIMKTNELDRDMEFTAVLPTNLLRENVCGNNLLTNNNRKLSFDNDMELTAVIPSDLLNVNLNPEYIYNAEKDDMEFITNITLEKQQLKIFADNKTNANSSNNLIINYCERRNINHPQIYEISDKENITIKSKFSAKSHETDFRQIEQMPNNSSCQFIDASFHTNPTSEVDDTQYLINYKSRGSEGSVLSTAKTTKYNEDSLGSKLIPNLRISHSDKSSGTKNTIAITLEQPKHNLLNENPTKINELTINRTNDSENRSEIDVFKPSSKNNTRYSFFESMEIGTPYITACEESGEKINQQIDENLIKINRYETDKVIFASELACSLELTAPKEAVAILTHSISDKTEENIATTHETVTYNKIDKSLSDDNPADNLSASTIALYISETDDSSADITQNADVNSPLIHTPEKRSANKPPPLSDLPDISPNCSIDELYDLLGWSEEDMPRGVPLPPRISAEEKERQRVARAAMRSAEEKGFERLVLACHKMVQNAAQIDRENAIRDAEELARSQGRCLRPQTVEEWLRQQRRTRSTLWSLKSLTNDKCVVSSRYALFNLEMKADSFIITNTIVENINVAAIKQYQFISKLFLDMTQKSQIQSAIGTKYNLRTFLEYIQMKLDDVTKIERAFRNIFYKVLVEAQLSFDDNLILQYLLIGRSRWLIKINCFDINNLSVDSIVEMTTVSGNVRVPEKEIKNIAKKCARGLPFLARFVDGVYEFRNMRERKYCMILNTLLNKMESKMG